MTSSAPKPPVSTAPVCVTGAAGYIASHLVAQLLARGYRVRGTVRSLRPEKEKDIAHLRALPGASDRLELVEADLMKPGSFDGAVAGCEYVMHTASPYVLDAKDPQHDLVDPAVQGTQTVLESCQRAGTVKRVVLTSSMAAITDEPDSDHVLTEADWNTKSTLERNPYYLSKTLAEKAGWEFVEKAKPGFDLVVINPFLVIGPSLSAAINTSPQMFIDLLRGAYPGVMSISWGFVDVRDVALSHVLAMEVASAKGRYICANRTISMRDLVEVLRTSGYGAYKLPSIGLDCGLGDYVVRLSSYLQPKGIGSYLRTHVGRVPRFDHGKIESELGLKFRPLEESILDTLTDLKKWGHITEPRG
ncbi:MAG TPA: SDR family oxidoreductase [Pseudomonadota bacterium]|nr:SDR family oxidoreductase [Pseudomonadota bacterium]